MKKYNIDIFEIRYENLGNNGLITFYDKENMILSIEEFNITTIKIKNEKRNSIIFKQINKILFEDNTVKLIKKFLRKQYSHDLIILVYSYQYLSPNEYNQLIHKKLAKEIIKTYQDNLSSM